MSTLYDAARLPQRDETQQGLLARLVEVLVASRLGMMTVTNDGVITWVYTPPETADSDDGTVINDEGII